MTINSLLFLAAIDLTAEPYYNNASDVIFTRVGAVYPDAVKIAVRYPDTIDPLYVVWRQSRAQLWSLGPEFNLTEENDWVGTVTLSQLYPSTEYECAYKLVQLLRYITNEQTLSPHPTGQYCPIQLNPSTSRHSPTLDCTLDPSSAS